MLENDPVNFFYFTPTYEIPSPNQISENLLHHDQAYIAHHLDRISFSATSNDDIHCCTLNSKSIMKSSKFGNPSWVGRSYTSFPIHQSDFARRAHLLIYTSCSMFCQFSSGSLESNKHELMLLQLNVLFLVGLT